jgi:glycerophosphoryl diester phosphodiesterase
MMADRIYRYVGKYIANLTLAQIQTLDCGSKRQSKYRKLHLPPTLSFSAFSIDRISPALQTLYPQTRIPTLRSLFTFLSCADPHHRISLNIESKSNALYTNRTRSPNDFVRSQLDVFREEGRPWLDNGKITYQSFDWRTLEAMKVGFLLLIFCWISRLTERTGS